jgi:hypothetical protein
LEEQALVVVPASEVEAAVTTGTELDSSFPVLGIPYLTLRPHIQFFRCLDNIFISMSYRL